MIRTYCLLVLLAAGGSPIERGADALRKHDFKAAEPLLRQAIRDQPKSARAHKLLGMAYSGQEKYSLAEESFRQACSLDPREVGACYFLGRLYYTLNRYEDSHAVLETAIRHKAGVSGQLLHALALTLEAQGETQAAEQNYRAAAQTSYRQALIDYGMFLYRHGRAKESIEILRKANATEQLARVTKAVDASPRSASLRSPIGAIHFESQSLPMIVKNGARGDKHQIETMLGGVAVLDYDNDSWPDIYVANGASIPSLQKTDSSFHNRLFRNNRDGTFSDVTAKAGVAGNGYSMGLAAADYDNDGHTDLFVTGVRSNTLYRNLGNGVFEDVTERAGLLSDGSWSIAAAWFDYDNDGLLDLFVVRYVRWDPTKEPYCGLSKRGYRVYCHPKHYEPLPNALYRNEGGGRFRDVSRESGIAKYLGKGMGAAIGDYDRDGLLDIFVASDTTPNFLFRNRGKGAFEEVAVSAGVAHNAEGVSPSSMGAEFRDYDNDGWEDLFVTDLSNERFLLFRNIGRGQFADMSDISRIAALSLPWSGWSTGMFDFNNDGWKDLFVASGNVMDNAELTSSRKSRQPNLIFVNRAESFELQLLPGEAFHRGAAFGDFDQDGRVDIAVTRLNEAPIVLRNRTSPNNHWIEVRLTGAQSNRDGIGAMVHIRTQSSKQWNRATTSVGYAGSSDRTVHFGLGGADHIAAVEIEWPSGIRQTFTDISVNQRLTVQESRQ